MLHYYDFIDFKPEVDDLSIFNPCEVYNSGARCRETARVARRGSSHPLRVLGHPVTARTSTR